MFLLSKPSNKILEHHIKNQGISRFEKIPLYLELSHKELTQENIEYFTNRFSDIVIEKVINSEWVEGVLDLIINLKRQKHVIVTVTPQNEIEIILQKLNIREKFE